jgi:tetrahydromethanopterin S-methyltransferase subunit E
MDDKDLAIISLTIISLFCIGVMSYIGYVDTFTPILTGIIGAISGIAVGRKNGDENE